MSAAMHDVSHAVAGEDWRRQAAEADKSGAMMAELLKQTEMQQALYEVATAGKRVKNPKPGWRLQERDRRNLLVAIETAKQTTYVDVHKIVHVDSCERMLYCLLEQNWLDAHDQYGWSALMHAVEAGKNEHVAALLRAGAQKDHRSLQTYGNHPKGSTALDIARRMQGELGIDRKDIIAQLEYEPAKEVVVKGSGSKMSVGLLGKLKKKKMAAQAQVAIDSTLGYKTADAEDNRTTTGEAGKENTQDGGSAWGSLKGNLRAAQGKGPDFVEVVDAAATASGINLGDMRKQLKEHLADKEKHTSVAQGYELATSTVHVGSIGHETHRAALDERTLIERFEDFGAVDAAVIRYRDPTPEKPHNSWALLAFTSIESVDTMMQGKETAKIPASADGGDGDDAVVFTVRRIDPKQAMESTGSFGKIFQECRARVQKARSAKNAGDVIPDAWKASPRRTRLPSGSITSPRIDAAQGDSKSSSEIDPALATEVTTAEAQADDAEARAAAAEAALASARQRRAEVERAAAERTKGESTDVVMQRLEQQRLEAERKAREWASRAVEADALALAAENERKKQAAQPKGPSEAEVRRLITKQLEDALGEAASAVNAHPLSPNVHVRGWSHSPRTGSLPKGSPSASYKRTTPDELRARRSSPGEGAGAATVRTMSGRSTGYSERSAASPTGKTSPPPERAAPSRRIGASSVPLSIAPPSSSAAATRKERTRPERANRRARTSPGARRRQPPAGNSKEARGQQRDPSPEPTPPPGPASGAAPIADGSESRARTMPPLPVKTRSDRGSSKPSASSPRKIKSDVPLHKQALAESLPLPSKTRSKGTPPPLPNSTETRSRSSLNTIVSTDSSLTTEPAEHVPPRSPPRTETSLSSSSSRQTSPRPAGDESSTTTRTSSALSISSSRSAAVRQQRTESVNRSESQLTAAERAAARKKQREERRQVEAQTGASKVSASQDVAATDPQQSSTAAERAALRKQEREARRQAVTGESADVSSSRMTPRGSAAKPASSGSTRRRIKARASTNAGKSTPTRPSRGRKAVRKSEFFDSDGEDDHM